MDKKWLVKQLQIHYICISSKTGMKLRTVNKSTADGNSEFRSLYWQNDDEMEKQMIGALFSTHARY